jgi:hypothetical protein
LLGDLKPWDEPRQLLEGALERFKTKGKAKGRRGPPGREARGESAAQSKQEPKPHQNKLALVRNLGASLSENG